MAKSSEDSQPLSVKEAFDNLTVNYLKPLALLVASAAPARKDELVAMLKRFMTNPAKVRNLYEQLDPSAQQAVQEATHDPEGKLRREPFEARYGDLPKFHEPSAKKDRFYSSDYDSYKRPTPLCLFFPQYHWLPADLQALLLTFVPKPPEFQLPTLNELPATVLPTRGKDGKAVPLRVRETAREAEQDLRAVLRLIETGRVRVTDLRRQPTADSLKAVAEVLASSDFYAAEDQEKDRQHDPAANLTIKVFAWPMIVQAGELAHKSGNKLALTPAGRKALTGSAADAIRAVYRKWRTSSLLDEFSRMETIKGQGNGKLSALAGRRKAVLDGLAQCPAGAWFQVDDFFCFLRATGRDFVLSHAPVRLYIAEHYYGHFGRVGGNLWEMLQGRYILVVLLEYIATLGLIDVAYIPPQGVRCNFSGCLGFDDLSCLSRYDGLLYARINPLGAWCLGLTKHYEAPAPPAVDVLRVLPNLEVVVTKMPLAAADRLVLDRFAEQQSEGTWRLTDAKILDVLEEDGTLEELVEFLRTHGASQFPQTVRAFLDDLRERAGQLRDLGTVRLVECADATMAQMLAVAPHLRGRCQLAGERGLVFRASEETAVRRALRRLGYVLPPARQ